METLRPSDVPHKLTRRGTPVPGSRCPSCGQADQIYRGTGPIQPKHCASILFFGILGALDSHSDCRGWMLCGSCGHQFRRRTARLAWIAAGALLLAAGAIAPFLILPGTVPLDSHSTFTQLISSQPTASLLSLVWILGFISLSIAIAVRRVRQR